MMSRLFFVYRVDKNASISLAFSLRSLCYVADALWRSGGDIICSFSGGAGSRLSLIPCLISTYDIPPVEL